MGPNFLIRELQRAFLMCFIVQVSLVQNASLTLNFTNPNLRLNKCPYNEITNIRRITFPNYFMGHNETTTFRLQNKCATKLPHCQLKCPTEVDTKVIEYYQGDQPESHITPWGYLKYGSDFFNPEDYCIFKATKHRFVVEICRPSCGRTHVCVPRCCSADKVLDFGNDGVKCKYVERKVFEPIVYKREDVQVCGERKANFPAHFIQSVPDCDRHIFFLKTVPGMPEHFRVKFRLLINGSVIVRELLAKDSVVPPRGTYCLDGIQNFGNNPVPYNGNPFDQILVACVDGFQNTTYENEQLPATGILYCILLFSGTPFLLMTVVMYLLVWKKQNIHGYTLFSHTLAMLLNYLFQGITNTVTRLYKSNDNASPTCSFIGIANHYFALASFCWMTMINYDLWSMFRHLRNTVGRSKGMKRFAVYMMFGWGIPFVFVAISVILDFKFGLYGDHGEICEEEIIVPFYGHKSCYMVEEARPIYLFYPIATLLTINIIFAIMTFYNMAFHKKETESIKLKSTKHKRRFSIWMKLFTVMGIAYSTEVIVWNFKEKNETLPWYLAFPDVISVIQAVAIFVLFACQPKIINQLKDSYSGLTGTLDSLQKFLSCCKKDGSEASADGENNSPSD